MLNPRFNFLGLAGLFLCRIRHLGGRALNRYFWKHLSDIDSNSVRHLADTLDIPEAGARFLFSRSIVTPEEAGEYLFPSISITHDPFAFENMQRAVTLVESAVREGKKLLIHGDYDVDGIAGTALLYQFFESQVPQVLRFLPDRRKDGYGLSDRAVQWAIENNVDLLITVDCGTSDGALVKKLLEKGIDVVVCDHHEFPSDGEAEGIILNPIRDGEMYPFKHLSGAGVAFKLVQALEKSGVVGNCSSEDLLDLLALATVGDLVPLIDENRFYVRAGLERMNVTLRPGLEVIRKSARLLGRDITARHISFVFAPRLNAPGRLANAKPALEILCTQDKVEAEKLGSILEHDNGRRRELTEVVRREVEEIIEGMNNREERGGYVLAGEEWDEGVLGIAASRVVETTGKPTILISLQGDLAKGSGRSVPGVNLKAQLDRCRHLLVKYGGHAQAIGLTMESSLLPDLEKELSSSLQKETVGIPKKPVLTLDADLRIDECTMELVEFLSMCEPFGHGNKEPVWHMRAVSIGSNSGFVGNGHLKLFFNDEDGRSAEAISFNWNRPLGPEELNGKVVDLAVTVNKGYYLERFYPEIRVVDIKPHGEG